MSEIVGRPCRFAAATNEEVNGAQNCSVCCAEHDAVQDENDFSDQTEGFASPQDPGAYHIE